MTPDFPKRLQELLDHYGILYVDDEVQSGCGRTGPVWAIEHYGVEPDLLVSGKTLGGGLPLAAVTGRAEVMDAVPPGGLGGTFGGNPRLVRRGDRDPRRARRARARAPRRSATRLRERLEAMAPRGLGGARARPDARARAARADRRARRRASRGGARAGADAALVRPLRQRDPHPRAVRDHRRRARARPRHPRGLPWRLTSRSPASRKTYGDVVAVDDVDLDGRRRRVLHAARPVGLGQDDDAADDRRLRAARRAARSRSAARTSRAARRTRATSTPSSRTTRSSRT